MQGFDVGRALTLDECDFARSRGFGFVARYVGRGSAKDKLTPDESGRILSRGLGILPLWELGGAGPWTIDQGRAEGAMAREDAISSGVPLGTPLVASTIDANVPGGSLGDFLEGVFEGLDGAFVDGIYGDYDVVHVARERFPALGFFMQTYAWSGGVVYAPADVLQHANHVELRPSGPSLVVDLLKAFSPIPWRIA